MLKPKLWNVETSFSILVIRPIVSFDNGLLSWLDKRISLIVMYSGHLWSTEQCLVHGAPHMHSEPDRLSLVRQIIIQSQYPFVMNVGQHYAKTLSLPEQSWKMWFKLTYSSRKHKLVRFIMALCPVIIVNWYMCWWHHKWQLLYILSSVSTENCTQNWQTIWRNFGTIWLTRT